MVSTDDGFLVIPISGHGPTLRAQVVAFHLETPRPAAWAPAEQKGLFHFLIGDPTGWRPRVPAYDHLTWQDACPGLDVRLTCEGGAPRYDLLVDHPAAVNDLCIRVEGADALEIGPEGELVAHLSEGMLMQTRPVAYVSGEDGTTEEVPVSFRLLGGDRYGFEAPPFAGRLTIDPTFSFKYASYLGGMYGEAPLGFPGIWTDPSNFDQRPGAIDVDSVNTVLVCGATYSTDFPTTAGAYDITLNVSDAVVTAFSGRLSNFEFSTFLGGSTGYGCDQAHGLKVNQESGTIYVVGWTDSWDFPVMSQFGSPYSTQPSPSSQYRYGFITAIDSRGANLLHSNVHEGAVWNDVAVLPISGEPAAVYAVGYAEAPFESTITSTWNYNHIPPIPPYQATHNGGGFDFAVLREQAGGTLLKAATFIGGDCEDQGLAITLVGDEPVVGGKTHSTPIPGNIYYPFAPNDAFEPPESWSEWWAFAQQPWDGAVTRLNADMQMKVPMYSGAFSGSWGHSAVLDLATASDGSVIAVGCTKSVQIYNGMLDPNNPNNSGFPTTANSFQPTKWNGTYVGFVAKIEPQGQFLDWCTYLQPVPESTSAWESVSAIGVAVLPNDNVVVTGMSESQNFPVTVTGFGGGVPIYRDAFLAVLKNTGDQLLESQFFGGSSSSPPYTNQDQDEGYAVAISPSGAAAYVLGATSGSSLPIPPPPPTAAQPISGGNEDFFVASFLMR